MAQPILWPSTLRTTKNAYCDIRYWITSAICQAWIWPPPSAMPESDLRHLPGPESYLLPSAKRESDLRHLLGLNLASAICQALSLTSAICQAWIWSPPSNMYKFCLMQRVLFRYAKAWWWNTCSQFYFLFWLLCHFYWPFSWDCKSLWMEIILIFFKVRYSTMLQLPPLSFHCVGGSNPGLLRLWHWQPHCKKC